VSFYAIVFWFSLGFVVGGILLSFYWFAVVVSMTNKGELFIKKNGKWIPKEPILQPKIPFIYPDRKL
jgi:hypothetical protein